MKKMVVLTEGQTEQLFVAEMLIYIASQSAIKIDSQKLYGGRRFGVIELHVSTWENCSTDPDFYILIIDCASDGRVVTALRERYTSFVEQSYEQIILIRDTRPDFEYDQVAKAYAGISKQLPNDPITPVMVLAVMEVEAWFIAELSHFPKISPAITDDVLMRHGINTDTDFEKIPAPADKLNEIYQTADITYGKSKADAIRTISALDMQLYLGDLADKIKSVSPLIEATTEFFRS